ncbi:WecB/TagA/CpsF family glycosyltransferase [Vibrio sp. 1159]|uniref:WecB/TagA/CpsF family glycosyltransferase n=1 Tax=Vibrio sp. 1159 TaxID=3074545 RepID=UPI002964EC18|nr:WecB/TagA/CpsF family glycosyltransferase [Vibrio sp. 1159]MDW2318790.1 WecB/TagA/CpsF family glycosyltransferase [Vibrio sp. 1159]
MNWLDKKILLSPNIETLLNNHKTNSIKVTFVNPFSYNLVEQRSEYKDVFDGVYVDGASLVKIFNLMHGANISRYSFDFSSIASDVLEFAVENSKKVAFIGGKQEEISLAVENIKLQYSGIDIVFYRNGYFNTDQELVECLKSLEELKVDLIIVGMGTPYQEDFISKIDSHLEQNFIAFTCGGFLSQTAVKGDYYHRWVKKLGLRWLQRAVSNQHVRKRLVSDYPRFFVKYVLRVAKSKFIL